MPKVIKAIYKGSPFRTHQLAEMTVGKEYDVLQVIIAPANKRGDTYMKYRVINDLGQSKAYIGIVFEVVDTEYSFIEELQTVQQEIIKEINA